MQKPELEELIARARTGDSAAFESLFNEFKNTAYGVALRLLHNEEDAEDVVQETAIQVFRRLETQRDPAAFFGWVRMIAVNLCKRKMKKNTEVLFAQQEEDSFYDPSDDQTENRPEDAADTAETRRIVAGMIEELPEDQRVCVHLFYAQNLSIEEIAEMLDVSPNTVKSRLYYARKKIGAQAEEYKKQGTPLYALAPAWLMRRVLADSYAGLELPQAASQAITESIKTTFSGAQSAASLQGANEAGSSVSNVIKAPESGTTSGAGGTDATGAGNAGCAGAASGGGFVAKIAALPLVTKIVAGAAAVVLLVTGALAGLSAGGAATGLFGGSAGLGEEILGSWSAVTELSHTTIVEGQEASFSDPEGIWCNLLFYPDGNYIFSYTRNGIDETERSVEAQGSYTVDGNKLLISEPTERDNQFWQAALHGAETDVSEIGIQLEDGVLKLVFESAEDPSHKFEASFKSDKQTVTVGDETEQSEKDLSELLLTASRAQEGEIIDVTDEWLKPWCKQYAGYWNIVDSSYDFLGGYLRRNIFFHIIEDPATGDYYYFTAGYNTGGGVSGLVTGLSVTKYDGKPAFLLTVEYPERNGGGSHAPASVTNSIFLMGPAYNPEYPMMRQLYDWDNNSTHAFYYGGADFDKAYQAHRDYTGSPF